MTTPFGSTTKRKQLQASESDFESHPDPIETDEDLAEFERMYQEEKAKLAQKKVN